MANEGNLKPNTTGAKRPGAGRKKGVPNKATTNARTAIAKLADANAPKLNKWLNEVYKNDGPKAALDVYVKLIEYCVPKLARQEVVGDGGGPLQHQHSLDASGLSDSTIEELMRAKPDSGD